MATPSGGPATGLPPTKSSPPLRSVSPAMQRRNVVLPQPLGPTMQRISCRRTSRVSWRNATTVPSRNSLLALREQIADRESSPCETILDLAPPTPRCASRFLFGGYLLRLPGGVSRSWL